MQAVKLTPEALLRHLEAGGSFKPWMRSHTELAGGAYDEMTTKRSDSHPTMFSTKLRDRLHFRPGEVTVWAGYNGHRKSMFVGQVVADLLVQKKRVLVMSMEMRPVDTVARIMRQMSACEVPSRAWVDRFASWSRSFYLFDYAGRINPDLALGACYWASDQLFVPHVVIDSLMMTVESEEHLDPQKRLVTDLVRFAQETGSHVHLVAHCRKPAGSDGEDRPPTKYDLRGTAAISDQCHNVCMVWANKPKVRALAKDAMDPAYADQPDAIVSVEKQRSGAWEGRVSLWFDQKSLRFCNDRLSPVEPYVMGD